tara:strand:+ start:915 stop:1235 length:321 start_codon:yes stop_codon:yes gene_type:complete
MEMDSACLGIDTAIEDLTQTLNDVPDWAVALIVMNSMVLVFCIVITVLLVLLVPFFVTEMQRKDESLRLLDRKPEGASRIKVTMAPKQSAKTQDLAQEGEMEDMEI